ncbi:hypothetical protein GXM_06108 [Nostoc sphaeroides CCNUC1]|uniref:Uncharacterized protein n=1 Tax=Nostoc sphaeroides CCNUC1 TaxID=2653204 RepID=A0A5P8W7H6_9NOSO|nr:hypothetical protein GXM_06108 [Nostoc sphaeroides CCNUC1]
MRFKRFRGAKEIAEERRGLLCVPLRLKISTNWKITRGIY